MAGSGSKRSQILGRTEPSGLTGEDGPLHIRDPQATAVFRLDIDHESLGSVARLDAASGFLT